MPGKSSKKDLYLGKTLSDLNKIAEIKDLGSNVGVMIKSADRTFKEAERQDSLADEERAYILYMKYFNVIQQAKKKPEYRKQKEYYDSLIGKKSTLKAIDRAEKLSVSLKDRYDEVEATAVAKKLSGLHQDRKYDDDNDSLDVVDDKKTKSKTDNKPSASTSNDEKENQSKTDLITTSISPTDLYKLLQDNDTKLILMDVRSADDFTDSHILHPSCINIPEEIIKPGTTVTHIANSLPPKSVSLWKQRGNVDHIVIFDWSSTEVSMTIGTTLRTLKDALFKYDSTVIIKSEPLILECGYEQWLLYYPMMSSNPRVSRPSPVQSVSSLSGLDFPFQPVLHNWFIKGRVDFEYPDLDEPSNIPAPKQPDQSEPSTHEPSNKNVPNRLNSQPLVDRTLKPKNRSSMIGITKNESNEKLNNTKSSLHEPKSKENLARIENSLYPDVGKSVNEMDTVMGENSMEGCSGTHYNKAGSSESTFSMGNRSMEGSSGSRDYKSSSSEEPSFSMGDRSMEGSSRSRDYKSSSSEESTFSMEAGFSDEVYNSSQIQKELVELRKIQGRKEEELAVFHREKKRMSLEHRARLVQLEQEQDKLLKLEKLRRKEEKDVADLMRMKRSLQEQMKNERTLQEEKSRDDEMEEKKRYRELDRIKQLELEKKCRQEEVERMRKQRKMKEDEKKRVELEREVKEQEIQSQLLSEIAERNRVEEEKLEQEVARAKEHAENIQHEEAEKQRAKEERKAQENEQKKIEEERKKEDDNRRKKEGDVLMKVKEDARKQQIIKEQQEKEKREEDRQKRERERVEKEKMTKLKKEENERRKKEDESRRAEELKRAQEAQKEAEKKLRKINEPHPQSKIVPSVNMPTGWEKRLDKATNRYFYIDHNNGTTQWEPPVLPNSPSNQGTYTAKLKEEPSISSQGLKRSFSSPDIMKLMEEQEKTTFPSVDRAVKPPERREAVVRASMPVQRVVKRRDLNPIYGNVGSALTGLRNLGNTCYMNSTIQCLNNTSPLVSYFLTENYFTDINRESFQGMHGEVVDEFAVVLKALWSRQYRCITPRDLKLTVAKYNPMFAGYEQQDSQEFLTFLLDGLHEGLNEVKKRPQIPDQDNDNFPDNIAADLAWKNYKLLHRSIIVELFQGQLKSTLQCKTCGKQSKTFQTFMFLSVPIPSFSRCSLNDCICEFLKPERMSGDSKWRCPRCKMDREATKKIDIWKLPPILLIGLNRFVRDGMWVQKKTSYVDFPVSNLDLNDSVQGVKSRNKYNLYAVSNHYGTMEGGHYTAFCRNPESQRWYKFDDHEVYEMSSTDVKSSAAYFLYYTSIEMQAPTQRL